MAAGSPPAALLGRAETPIRDRLITTLFLAAVLHGMLILGVSFVSDRGSGAPAPGLDVQLLAEEAPDETRDRPASYLAQRSRAGAGTTTARVAARTPLGLPAEEAPEAADEKAEPRPEAAAEALLTTTASRVDVRYSGAIDGPSTDQTVQSAAAEAAALRAALAALDAGGEDPGEKVQLTGPKTTAEGWVSPDTQASVVAPYMDAWRRKVERLGTLNYPKIASVKTPLVNPVVEIELAADGLLRAARIRRSSGNAELDQAALAILKLASPFDPFPSDLTAAYPVLRFAYEWQFVQSGGLLSVPPAP